MKLRDLRKEKGLTQTELAKKIGMSQTNYSYYETNDIMPSTDILIKLADIYGITLDKLLGVESFATSDDLVEYSVIGSVKCGYNGEVLEIPTGDTTPIPRVFLKGYKKDDFMVLRVQGDSMYPKLLENDLVLIHRQSSVDSGQTACVILNDTEATIKTVKYEKGEDWLELVPANPEYPTKRIEGEELEHCRVLGLVVKLLRDV